MTGMVTTSERDGAVLQALLQDERFQESIVLDIFMNHFFGWSIVPEPDWAPM